MIVTGPVRLPRPFDRTLIERLCVGVVEGGVTPATAWNFASRPAIIQTIDNWQHRMTTTISRSRTARPATTSGNARSASSGVQGSHVHEATTSVVEAQNAELAWLLTEIDAGLDDIDRINGRSTRRAPSSVSLQNGFVFNIEAIRGLLWLAVMALVHGLSSGKREAGRLAR